jgi:Ser/Thr protein kinase RdoA (MazF antagonist)
MSPVPLASPTPQEWTQLGFADVVELAGGRQSRVFSARCEHGLVAVKLTDASLVGFDLLEKRRAFVTELALVNESVISPVVIRDQLVCPFGDWFATATRLIEGKRLDTTDATDGELMGATLAELHSSMRRVCGVSLPDVDAMQVIERDPSLGLGPDQPLHGDFNSSNLRRTPAGLRIFDFDDCGNGPAEFDVANALYMVLFDALVNGGSMQKYGEFRTPFVTGYSVQAHQEVADTTLDSLIDLRIRALDYWITNLADAPIGIRTSSPAWKDVLRHFIQTWSELVDR